MHHFFPRISILCALGVALTIPASATSGNHNSKSPIQAAPAILSTPIEQLLADGPNPVPGQPTQVPTGPAPQLPKFIADGPNPVPGQPTQVPTGPAPQLPKFVADGPNPVPGQPSQIPTGPAPSGTKPV